MARVGDVLSDSLERLDVGTGPADENQRDALALSRVPRDFVRSTLRDLLVQAGGGDGVASGRLGVVGLSVSGGEDRQRGEDSSGGEAHFERDSERVTEVGGC